MDFAGNRMQHINKIALFDFCETLANYQTADAYIYYVIKYKKKNMRDYWFACIRAVLANKISRYVFYRFLHISVNKHLLLKQIKGMNRSDMQSLALAYYRDVVKPNLIPETLDLLKEYKMNGYRVGIVSAGYDIYLNCFVDEYGVDDLISTRLAYAKDVFLGKYEEPDCIRDNKVKLMKGYYGIENMKEWDSISYSDSMTDIPFLRFTKKAVVVARKNKPAWAEKEKFEVLIWD